MTSTAQIVEFKTQGQSDLINWVTRRFKALGKEIDRQSAEHLIFICGSLMTGLIPEIEKIAAYTRGAKITIEDINAVADPVIDAMIYDITNEISRRNYDAAGRHVGEAAENAGRTHRHSFPDRKRTAQTLHGPHCVGRWKGPLLVDGYLEYAFGYPAETSAGVGQAFFQRVVPRGIEMCKVLDVQMKSQTGFDSEGELKLLLMRLAQEVKE